MYRNETATWYKATDVITSEETRPVTDILRLEEDVFRLIKKRKPNFIERQHNLSGHIAEHIKRRADKTVEMEHVKVPVKSMSCKNQEINWIHCFEYGERIRHIRVTDNYGRMYGPELFVQSMKENRVKNGERPYNRARILKQQDSGYRKDPVSGTGRKSHFGRYGRRIAYKRTLLAAESDDCKEYGIKPCRQRTKVNAWDIEPVRHIDRCWKTNAKARNQWMIHMPQTDRTSIRYFTPNPEELADKNFEE